MARELAAEVCVAGGGPSGAVLARRLASLGHDVCLIERAPSAAGRPGESLAPGILPVLDGAGVRDAVEALGPLRPRRALVRWSTPEPAMIDYGAPGLLIDRARLDRALRDEAARAGARVLCPATAGRPARAAEPGRGWIVPVRAGAHTLSLGVRFFCDATGRRGLLGGPRTAGIPTLAIASHIVAQDRGWALPLEGPLVEALADTWLWAAPLSDGTSSVMAFVDPARVRRRTRAERARLLEEIVAHSTLLRGGGEIRTAAVHDATAYARASPVEPDAIRVGEASFAIDPLSSQGVQAAISSALQAAIVVHTLLVAPERASAAMRFYRDRRAEAVGRHATWAAQSYADRAPSLADPFWARRAAGTPEAGPAPAAVRRPPAPAAPLALAPGASLSAVPCIDGDLVVLDMALCHPTLDRPLAYLGDTPIAPLLAAVARGDSADAIVTKWSCHVALDRARAILAWLVSRGILEQAPPMSLSSDSVPPGETALHSSSFSGS